MRLHFFSVLGFLALKLVGLLVNLATFPTLRRTPSDTSDVSLLIPARNEEHRLTATLPGLLEQPTRETVLLDDRSTDATPELARSLGDRRRGFRVVTGAPAPPEWVGKTWASHQLAQEATGDVFAFCDADVTLAPGALATAVAEMRRQRADVFSVFPRQRTETLGERLIVPLVDDALLCFLPFPLLSADVPSAATANGSLILITRSAYESLGGFAAIRAELVEDVALARRCRRRGLRLGLALGGDLVGTRMYTGYREAVVGLGRGLLPVAGGSRVALVAALVWQVLVYTVPVLLAPRRPRWWVAVALGLMERCLIEAKTGRRSWPDVALVPLSPPAAVAVVARAVRRRQTWKGRTYP